MRRTTLYFIIILIFCVQSLRAEYTDANGVTWSEDPARYVKPKLDKESELRRDLSKSVISWLSENNEAAGKSCEEYANQLLNLENPRINSYLAAAQSFYLRNNNERAISILEDIAAKYPDKISEQGGNMPVKIHANLLIAKISKESGNYDKALAAYQKAQDSVNLDNNFGLLKGICILYMCEIEQLQSKDPNIILKRLEKVQDIEPPQNEHFKDSIVIADIEKSWAKYEYTKIAKGKEESHRQLLEDNIQVDPLTWKIVFYSLAAANGMDNFYVIWSRELSPETYLVGNAVWNRSLQGKSSIDKMTANIMKAEWLIQRKNYKEAADIYSSMYEEDMYFSPVAGLALAGCKQKMGREKEAEDMIEQVKAKYPKYDSIANSFKAQGYNIGM